MKKWQDVLQKYAEYSIEQIERFKEISKETGEDCPYLALEDIDIRQISSAEKEQLEQIDITSKYNILLKINQILGRFKKIAERKTSKKEAEEKLCKINKFIPEQATIDLEYFHAACLMYIVDITFEELKWIYHAGYIPHLYIINSRPRFHINMWFMVDFAIRKMREETGLGIFSGFKDLKNLPDLRTIRLRLDLVHYIYFSWLIMKTIYEYARNLAKSQNLKNEYYHIAIKNIQESLYKNEGKVLSDKLMSLQSRLNLDTIKNYRDMFALYSFEAFPLGYLIHYGGTEKWRTSFLVLLEEQGLLSTRHPAPAIINTYHQRTRQEAFGSLSYFTEGALALHEKREPLGAEDIIEMYHHRSNQENKRPCRICGEYFKASKKTDVTCGKTVCINENKNRSKRKLSQDKLKFF